MADPRYVDEDELIGKTIDRLANDRHGLLIRFTDGSFTMIVQSNSYYGESCGVDFEEPEYPEQLVRIGVITKEEYEAVEKARKEAAEIESKMNRKQEYERLKREFES